MPLTQKHGSYIISKFNKSNIRSTLSRLPNVIQLTVGKLRQHMLHKVHSELTQVQGASIILKKGVSQNS